MNIRLCKMTKALCRAYFQEFVQDPALYLDQSKFQPYIYNEAKCDAYFDRYVQLGRIHFAIMLDSEPVGEVILKNIDYEKQTCAMGICMKNDSYKNKGYGTQAEILALEYAFHEMGMATVFADTIITNQRSQHVLTKVGFIKTHQDESFYYYQCDKSNWNPPEL